MSHSRYATAEYVIWDREAEPDLFKHPSKEMESAAEALRQGRSGVDSKARPGGG